MSIRIVLLTLIGASLGFGAVTTQPVGPATRAAGPSTMPATMAVRASIHELAQKIKDMNKEDDSLLKVAYFDLSNVVEKPEDFSLFQQESRVTLQSVIHALHRAQSDPKIRAVLVTLGQADLRLAQAQEIRDALAELTKAGKPTFVYADSYDTAGYTLASGASNICLMSGGDFMIPGVGMDATFVKGLLDKIGVTADYVQIGEYKGADEQFTRTGPSDELRGELTRLTGNLYDQIVDGIASYRHVSRREVKKMIDDALLTAQEAKDRGFVDHLVDQSGLRELIAKEIGGEIKLEKDYGQPERDAVDLSSPFAFFSLLARRPEVSDKPAVAVIYADGVIVDGPSAEGMFEGGTIGSQTMRRAFRDAQSDSNIKAVVIRINSPGGSAVASEAMWQAAQRVGKEKPVIVSVGTMAASGGYYLASAGQRIFADPAAIVGSIGVVGGKFVLKDLFDKVGITTESFRRGSNADLFSDVEPFSDKQRQMLTDWMKQTYEMFTRRVMSTRAGKIKDIDAVARGRIFVARQALGLGLVDELGGLEDAVAYAAGKAHLTADGYEVRILPAPKTLADLFNPQDEETATPLRPRIELTETSVLRAMGPEIRRAFGQELLMLQLLEERPVALISPVVITVGR